MSFSSPSKYEELPNLELDCPHPTCGGWLIGFKLRSDTFATDPAFIKCSEADCKQRVMLSQFDSRCVICKKSIFLREIITKSEAGGPWVHCNCFESQFSKAIVGICLRCKDIIKEKEDYIETSCGAKSGCLHLGCVPKNKKRSLQQDSSDDTDFCSSQDDSIDSTITPPPPTAPQTKKPKGK